MTRDHIVATLRSIGPQIGSEAVALIEQIETERDELLVALDTANAVMSLDCMPDDPQLTFIRAAIARSRK